VLPADSGEFQLVAAELGVAHPPGFPLYTMLAHLFTRLPFIAPGAAVNLFSAVTSTLTLVVLYEAGRRLTNSRLAALLAVLALGSAATYWAQATTANVRSLTALLTTLAFWAVLRIDWQAEPTSTRRRLVLLGFVLMTGLVHHGSLLFMALIFAMYVTFTQSRWLRRLDLWLRWLAVGLVALLPLLYLPLRGAAGAWGAPADLTTWPGFVNHVLALGFRGDFFYFVEPLLLARRLAVMLNVWTFQFEPLLLLLMLVGLLVLLKRRPALGLLLAGTVLVHTLVSATYRAPQTVEYMMPAYIPAALALAAGADALLRRLTVLGQTRWASSAAQLPPVIMAITAVLWAALLLLPARQFVRNWPSYRTLGQSSAARAYAEEVLSGAPPDALVLADWHWATPLWYLQEVKGRRPDLTVDFVFPGAEPYGETWADRIAAGLESAEAVVATHFDASTYVNLPVAEPLGEAFLFSRSPRRTLPADMSPLEMTLAETVQLRGYRLDRQRVELGQAAQLFVAWEPVQDEMEQTALFAHLIGPDGRLYAQADENVVPRPAGLTVTRFSLAPRPGTIPGDYQVLVGVRLAAVSTDGSPTAPIAGLAVDSDRLVPYSDRPLWRTLPDGSVLVGYDWDDTLAQRRRLYLHVRTPDGFYTEAVDNPGSAYRLPAVLGPWALPRAAELNLSETNHYVPFGQGLVWRGPPFDPPPLAPGQTTTVPLALAAGQPVQRDLVMSVRLIGYQPDSELWAWWDLEDGVPAMGAIPTLKWIAGSTVSDPHWPEVATQAYPGQRLGAVLRIYDAFTGRTVPIQDEAIAAQAPWLSLGEGFVGGVAR
ncbi:MAG: DUF2723 domain-containing protein, partial [Candidatus Promineifilaceae bacterium]|nr:DUF2723 domain-containing protein [Candidatus Promineifilaceae bacterium]